VAVEAGTICGYVTVAAGSLEIEDLPAAVRRRLPDYPLPVLRLARLAVDAAFGGKGLGKELLAFTLELALRMRDDFGCVGVVVDAKPDAEAFYSRFGFQALEVVEGAAGTRPLPVAMFLPVREIDTAGQAGRAPRR
jgi:predicted N-acetyltransferase YhbS